MASEREQRPNPHTAHLMLAHPMQRVVSLLLDRGANVHARNDSALVAAAFKGHMDVAATLLSYGVVWCGCVQHWGVGAARGPLARLQA